MFIDSLTALTLLFIEEDSKLLHYLWSEANKPFAGIETTMNLENNLLTEDLLDILYPDDVHIIIHNLSKVILKRIVLQHFNRTYLKNYSSVEMFAGYDFPPVHYLVLGRVNNSMSKYLSRYEIFTREAKTVREFATKVVDKLIIDLQKWLQNGLEPIKINLAYYIRYPNANDPINENYFLTDSEYFKKYRLRAIYSLEIVIKSIIDTITQCFDTSLVEFPDNYYVYGKNSTIDPPEWYEQVASITTSPVISGVTWSFFENKNVTGIINNDAKLKKNLLKVTIEELKGILNGSPFISRIPLYLLVFGILGTSLIMSFTL
jgi:hypothetical protein